ncbi:SpoIIE family protein phosphatase [Streptomyces marispadix]|uniref:PAS domain-containing SpoIIE family protein phosphatase/ATP-binding protein n=1 Tax=Streptomyces marispadix TaxID=2922868 RepID=A0ABS9SYY8_9ACTN|nr:SpoIIE family protein phosphatase [Streptomyces marispadix]MCH6161256.1 PAS domain-containing SpoIIE family protein phosphatase/ATP-binding protein [Streptomyces marispadix]
MPSASFTLDHAAHITSWSPAAAAWFGRSAAAVLGRHCRSLFAGTALRALAEASSSAAAGRDYSRVVPVTSRDGEPHEVLLTCSPLTEPGGGSTGLLCEVSDTARDAEERGEATSRRNGTAPSGAGGSSAEAAPVGLVSPPDDVQTAFMDAFVRKSPHGMGVLDAELRYVLVNDALADFNGIPAREHIGRTVSEVVRPADRGEYEKHLRRVLETGDPLHNVLISGRTEGHRDRDRVWSVTFFRLTYADGRVLGLGGLIVDVTQRQTALLEASAVRQRLDLVNKAGSKVGTTLSMAETARELTQFVVPDFADVATVEMRGDFLDGARFPDPQRDVSTVRVAGRSGLGRHPSERPGDVLPTEADGEYVHPVGSPAHESLCSGRSWHNQKLAGAALAEMTTTQDEPGVEEHGLGSVVMVPLLARGRCLGVVTFGRSPDREPLDDEDRLVAEELTARTALNLDNARLYDEERRIALALQRNMLPSGKDLPRRPGLEVGYHYWSTSRSANVGGDWFDVIPLSGHRVALVVGDMMGHDIHAAAGMGQLRTAMHTLARLDLEPVDLLKRLDNIVEFSPAMQHATCVYAVYNTVTRECSVANAGHPAPMLRQADSTTAMIEVDSGIPLGVGIGSPEFAVTDLVLPEGGTLVLYTDGLIERRGKDIDDGIESLRVALSDPGPSILSVQQWCDSVVGELTDWTDGDDLAVLMARAKPMPEHRSARWSVASEPGAASRARALVGRTLHDWGLDELVDTAQLLTNELVTNAYRHARGEIGLQLAKGGTLVVEVSDQDERLPHRAETTPECQWGRGLTLVDGLAQKWGARSITSGKVVWFELPLTG